MLQVIVDSFFFIVSFNPVVILFKTVHPEFKLFVVFKFHVELFLFNEQSIVLSIYKKIWMEFCYLQHA